MKTLLPILPLLGFLASCGTESKPTAAPERPGLEARMNQKNGYTQDANGQWVPQNDKRSSFEQQRQSSHFKGEYGKKEYKAGEYTKKTWWGGDTSYDKKAYAGNTDGSRFQTENRNSRKSSREATRKANEAGNSYATSDYKTASARETQKANISNTSDAETDVRRRVFDAPSVVDWQSQRQMSIQESRSILGR
ncbi:MAG: hypothetical protein QM627_00420 [Luteolibacter sp.]